MILRSNTLFGLPSKMIMDPVHGGIPLFSHEEDIIDHPLFQRLRHILQNDILTLVFPGSQHTRFQHSIGVMHLAGQFFQNLVKAYIYQFKNKEDLSSDLIESINYVYCSIRLSALLHDTGHCPFSHQFENSKLVSQLLNNSMFESHWKGEDYKVYFKDSPGHVEHEHISIRITQEIFKGFNNLGIAVEDVIYFMEKSENKASDTLSRHSLNIISALTKNISPIKRLTSVFISEIIKKSDAHFKLLEAFKTIISGEIDVDKMDYILRDSYFSGSKYGVYNTVPILNSLRVGYKYDGFRWRKNTWVGIALDPKGIRAVEDFIYSRYQLYLELYNHKTVCGFKYLLSLALDEVLENPVTLNQVKEYLYDINKFHMLTDTFIWERFKEIEIKNPKSACSHIVNRKRLDCVYKGKNLNDTQINEHLAELSKEAKSKICYWKSPLKFSKINDFFDKIRILKRQPDGTRKLTMIKEETEFFSLFKEKIELVHFFKDPNLEYRNKVY